MERRAVLKYEERLLREYIRSFGEAIGHCIVDVGGNMEADISAPFIEAGWRGVVVEPQLVCVEALKRKFQGRPNVTIVQAACSDVSGEMKLFHAREGAGSELATLSDAYDPWMKKVRSDNFEIVKVRRLDDIIQEHLPDARIGVLKIDTESWDYNVLLGLDLQKWKPSVIITEEYLWRHAEAVAKHLLLEDAGYVNAGFLGFNTIWLHRDLGARHITREMRNWLKRLQAFPDQSMGAIDLLENSPAWDAGTQFSGPLNFDEPCIIAQRMECMDVATAEKLKVMALNYSTASSEDLILWARWFDMAGAAIVGSVEYRIPCPEGGGWNQLVIDVAPPPLQGRFILEIDAWRSGDDEKAFARVPARQDVVVLDLKADY